MADRVAVITGAGSGIGRASALALCKDGWSVALLGRRKEALEETAGLATGGKTLPLPTDVADPDQVIAAFAAVKEKFGRVDMLFNNAGGNVPSTNFGDFTWEMWRRVVAVNLDAMFMCANQAFRMMRDQTPRGGRIINNGSISAHVPRPGSVAYTSTKHGVTGLTRSIALDGTGIRHLLRPDRHRQCGDTDDGALHQRANAALRPNGRRGADGRQSCRAAGGVHGQSAARVEHPVRDDHGDQDAVHRARLTRAGAAEPDRPGRPGHRLSRARSPPSRKRKPTPECDRGNLAWTGTRGDRRWDPDVQGHPVRRRHRRAEPISRGQTGRALDRHSRHHRLWPDVPAGGPPPTLARRVLGHRVVHERGLPCPEYLDSGACAIITSARSWCGSMAADSPPVPAAIRSTTAPISREKVTSSSSRSITG